MANISVYIPHVPATWASFTALEYLFQSHRLGAVKRASFGNSPDGLGIDARVDFIHWYDTQWSRYILKTLTEGNAPAYVVLLHSNEFLTLHRLYCDDDLDGMQRQLVELRREMGLQCMTCSNTKHLEEDDDECGNFYCSSCWFARNNAEAIRAKERDIEQMEISIKHLYTSEEPNHAYRVEELLERIQERRDEIAVLRTPKV